MQDESCEYCNGEVQAKKVTVHYCHKGRLVIIESVPAGVCRRCGERYYGAVTLLPSHKNPAACTTCDTTSNAASNSARQPQACENG